MLTLTDIQAMTNGGGLYGIDEISREAPEVTSLAASMITGSLINYSVRVGIPRVRFTNVSEGVKPVSSKWVLRQQELAHLESLISATYSSATKSGIPISEIMSEEIMGVTKSAILGIGAQTIYGLDVDPKGFPGLRNLVDDSMCKSVIDGKTTQEDGTTSVYFVSEGRAGFEYVYGNSMGITMDAPQETLLTLADGKQTKGIYSTLEAWVGQVARNKHAVGMLTNINKITGLTDQHISDFLAGCPLGMRPTAILMNPMALNMLRKSRTVTIVTSGPLTGATQTNVPVPDSVDGIRIIATDSILNDESAANIKALSKLTEWK